MSAKLYLIGLFCCALIVQGSSGDDTPAVDSQIKTTDGPETTAFPTTVIDDDEKKHDTTTSSTTTSSTEPPKTTPPTTSTSTTTTPSTTTPSTTTTSKTTTTATPPTTTSSPPTTSTPSTTTVSPPTTTAPPTPKPLPEPEVGSWVLSNSTTNLTCAIIHMALRIKIPYISTENQTQEWALLNLPKDANFTGICNDDSIKSNVSQVRLWWSNNTDYLDITFKRYNESKSFNITNLYLTQNVSEDAFPNNTMKGMVHYQGNGSGLFEVKTVPLGSSYRCSHKVSVNLTEVNASAPRNAILSFSKVQVQAFVNSTSGTFGGVYDCPGMDTSDIVPIAVGCALAGLVIGVLIAYLVGRRRSHARGYLSM
ncbi:lysosome-associated membrane glycoprotein 2-like [Ischnura elegans]|uniref:lysosome-associated membrane glycoprotein 2-like n=1 Tax=Ischnura elegans TaxID=197161 RepID=UPI001ED88FCD|nr:lysosome-associated membrane glycoprotein 2-like [Ischnura elegans]